MSTETQAHPEPELVPIRQAQELLGLSRSALEKRLSRRGLELVRVVEAGTVRCYVRRRDLDGVAEPLERPHLPHTPRQENGEAARRLSAEYAAERADKADKAAEALRAEVDALRLEVAKLKGELHAAEIIERNNTKWLEKEEMRHEATKEALERARHRASSLEATLEVFRDLDKAQRLAEVKEARRGFFARLMPWRG
jgi:hypothetical protein